VRCSGRGGGGAVGEDPVEEETPQKGSRRIEFFFLVRFKCHDSATADFCTNLSNLNLLKQRYFCQRPETKGLHLDRLQQELANTNLAHDGYCTW
jgi:hypothetical protein